MTRSFQLPEFTVGDCHTFMRQLDGDWFDLYNETRMTDELVQKLYPEEYSQSCRCVDDHPCAMCEADDLRTYGWLDDHAYDHMRI